MLANYLVVNAWTIKINIHNINVRVEFKALEGEGISSMLIPPSVCPWEWKESKSYRISAETTTAIFATIFRWPSVSECHKKKTIIIIMINGGVLTEYLRIAHARIETSRDLAATTSMEKSNW